MDEPAHIPQLLPGLHLPLQPAWIMRFFAIKVLRILQGPSGQNASHVLFGTFQLIPTEAEGPT